MTIGTVRFRFVGPEPITPEITMSFGPSGLFARRLADGVGSKSGLPASSVTLMSRRPRAPRAAV